MYKEVKNKYAFLFKNRKFVYSLIFAFLLLFASLFINYYAGNYATEKESNSVTDIVLSNIQAHDVDGFVIFSTLFGIAFIAFLCFAMPETMPFVLKSVALFVLIRSVFISLTHLGPFPTAVVIDSNIINKFTFAGDLFFSGHTGLPFLMSLIYWKNKILRYAFLVASVVIGATMLLGHLHYSIDVLAAFFITYAIFHLAEFLFKKDRLIFNLDSFPLN